MLAGTHECLRPRHSRQARQRRRHRHCSRCDRRGVSGARLDTHGIAIGEKVVVAATDTGSRSHRRRTVCGDPGSGRDRARRSARRKGCGAFPANGLRDCAGPSNRNRSGQPAALLQARGTGVRQTRKPPRKANSLLPSRAFLGQFFQSSRIAAAKHHVVGFQGLAQLRHHVCDIAPPFLGAELAAAALTHVVLIAAAVLVRQVRQVPSARWRRRR